MYSEDDVEDEKIRAAYLVNLLGSFGQHVGLPEAEEIIKEATASNNTFISKKEFNEMIAKNDEDDDALTVFALFDKDGDGEITAAELRYQLTELKEHMTDDQVPTQWPVHWYNFLCLYTLSLYHNNFLLPFRTSFLISFLIIYKHQ